MPTDATTATTQWLVDVSLICGGDAGTGIQRVVRNLYAQLRAQVPPGCVVVPVTANAGQRYRCLPLDFMDRPSAGGDVWPSRGTAPAFPDVRADDLYFGLDLAPRIVSSRLFELMRWRRLGVQMSFMVYDLLPVLEPRWFNPTSGRHFEHWLRTVAIVADKVVCISGAAEREFQAWMLRTYGMTCSDVPSTVIRLGADLGEAAAASPVPNASELPAGLEDRAFVLMVGTIEPRKAHAEVLDAFEPLWKSGEPTALVIAGKAGWNVEPLVQQLNSHPRRGTRLFWLDAAPDALLHRLYAACSGLIMASKGEGFGLPIVEAQQRGRPVLLRDIPIFRETALEPGAMYFPDGDESSLQPFLARWLGSLADESIGGATPLSLASWADTCRQLIRVLSG